MESENETFSPHIIRNLRPTFCLRKKSKIDYIKPQSVQTTNLPKQENHPTPPTEPIPSLNLCRVPRPLQQPSHLLVLGTKSNLDGDRSLQHWCAGLGLKRLHGFGLLSFWFRFDLVLVSFWFG